MTLIVIVIFFLKWNRYLDSNSLVSRLHEFKTKKKKKDNEDIELTDSSNTGAKPPLWFRTVLPRAHRSSAMHATFDSAYC